MEAPHCTNYVCSRTALNTGIFSKLRHSMSLAQLKQRYCGLVHPYISSAILTWGSGFKLKLKKYKQNKTQLRTIFFATTCGKNTESAFPLMYHLDIPYILLPFLNCKHLNLHIIGIVKFFQIFLITFFSMLMIFRVIIRHTVCHQGFC